MKVILNWIPHKNVRCLGVKLGDFSISVHYKISNILIFGEPPTLLVGDMDISPLKYNNVITQKCKFSGNRFMVFKVHLKTHVTLMYAMLSTGQFWSYIYDIIAVKSLSKMQSVFANNSKSPNFEFAWAYLVMTFQLFVYIVLFSANQSVPSCRAQKNILECVIQWKSEKISHIIVGQISIDIKIDKLWIDFLIINFF